MEAARSLGLSKNRCDEENYSSSSNKNILPALGNEFVTVIKETSLFCILYW